MTELHERIKETRKRAGLTQEDIAKKCGLSRNAVTLWESNDSERRTAPQIPQIRIICETTGAPVSWLLDESVGLTDDWEKGDDFPLTRDEKELVSLFRNCDIGQQMIISAFAQFNAATSEEIAMFNAIKNCDSDQQQKINTFIQFTASTSADN